LDRQGQGSGQTGAHSDTRQGAGNMRKTDAGFHTEILEQGGFGEEVLARRATGPVGAKQAAGSQPACQPASQHARDWAWRIWRATPRTKSREGQSSCLPRFWAGADGGSLIAGGDWAAGIMGAGFEIGACVGQGFATVGPAVEPWPRVEAISTASHRSS
jgi:hypothetical protein